MWTWVWFVAFVVVSSMYYKLYKKVLDNDKNILNNKELTRKLDLQKIDDFRKEIYSTEKKALMPMRECLPYTNNLQKSLANLSQIRSEVLYAKNMCEEVVKIY